MLSRSRLFLLLLLSITHTPLALSIDKENVPSISKPDDSKLSNPGIHDVHEVIENISVGPATNTKLNTEKNGAVKTIAEHDSLQSKAIEKKIQLNNTSKPANASVTSDKGVNKTETDVNTNRIPSKLDLVESGALRRGFYVFLGLSIIIVIYFFCRSYRLRSGGQPSTKVRKYGVLARRSDMEMRPLELDDEDDDTLFEINNQSPKH